MQRSLARIQSAVNGPFIMVGKASRFCTQGERNVKLFSNGSDTVDYFVGANWCRAVSEAVRFEDTLRRGNNEGLKGKRAQG